MSSSHAANSKQAFKCTCGHKRSHDSKYYGHDSFLMQTELPGTHIIYIYIRVAYLQSFAVSEYMLWAASPCFKPSKLGGSKSDATCKNFKAASK
jgi:hypothetical protein